MKLPSSQIPKSSLYCIFTVILWLLPQAGLTATTLPQRIISLGPINTENIYLLGAEDRLLADTQYCVRPEAAKNKPKIGSVMQVSIEKIISYRPDLVLATGLTSEQQVKKLQTIGLNVVRFSQPSSFEDICTQFLRLGVLLGLEKRAKNIIQQARNEVKIIEQGHKNRPSQKVLLQVGAQPLVSSIKGSFTNDFITFSGGINIAGNRKNPAMNREQVIAANPDVIIIAMMGSQAGGVAGIEQKKWQKFKDMKAVQDNRVHIIDPDLVCSPSPLTFVEALKKIAALINK